MWIAGIAASFPSRVVTNDDILELIAAESRDTFEGDLARSGVLRRIRRLLVHSGARSRRWLAPGETPIGLLAGAVERALAESRCDPADIDLLIYTGVGGGFAEPGNAHLVAHALGLRRTRCFDLVDACNSWARAVELTYHWFRSDPSLTRTLIVNAEFNMYPGGPGVPDLFRLRRATEVAWRFPAYTIGEAATATLLVNQAGPDWQFLSRSRPDLADLCHIPRQNYRGYCTIGLDGRGSAAGARLARNGPDRFTSFASELFAHAVPEAVNLLRQLPVDWKRVARIFPHASSKHDWDHGASLVGVRDLLFHIYPDYGNVVSASVPAAIALARDQGEIQRGDRLVWWIASAGMSFSVCSFVF
ncbi:MAG TPA: 3-oxoacyl-[acyl-carrier-protein] synthase III C-terminal domain-containing protein [Vicinamibacterales bacterium]|nr:3-oxoacyl-[acyl-carrier-protein] synthase III C-terminal domain-containing protein [Vicinamibacterales bacterium]